MPNTKSQSTNNTTVVKSQKLLPKVHVRKLTVSYQVQIRNEHLYHRDYVTVPILRICGKWLEEAGFTVSSTVNITVKDNLLVIENAKE